ncbi:hypothetical protein TNIN_260661 [Trichonephila inaurata madagascariensis]|uniref:Uncharacterized protein n=1 Tax=Trichonephila inaurata madagascariensis TaxID=2747483 RepID=A0A8X6YTN9_9ARAC|nr:hypothetical protein TNIN_351071 [Trichonephila inaurata madagascariensis]GFY76905.1 hypothetical protein TNIN_260661 [Trichonephila inaurata madagascariensis]
MSAQANIETLSLANTCIHLNTHSAFPITIYIRTVFIYHIPSNYSANLRRNSNSLRDEKEQKEKEDVEQWGTQVEEVSDPLPVSYNPTDNGGKGGNERGRKKDRFAR